MPEVKDNANRYLVTATMSDVPHLDEAAQEAILASMPAYQREARRTGVPSLGIGLIYPIDEAAITIQDFELPSYYPRGYGLDTGWNWTAALWGALDRETDWRGLHGQLGETVRLNVRVPVTACSVRRSHSPRVAV